MCRMELLLNRIVELLTMIIRAREYVKKISTQIRFGAKQHLQCVCVFYVMLFEFYFLRFW